MYELRLPLAPYRFVWRDDAAVDADKHATDSYTEERYRHADGTHTIIREYRADGSDGGLRYRLVEVIDLSRPGETDRLREELESDP